MSVTSVTNVQCVRCFQGSVSKEEEDAEPPAPGTEEEPPEKIPRKDGKCLS